ncbi:MAG: YsnF/AvaK domain-containing protein, partial [Chloroflexota bacterium]|nr:YsnF/AvaK domain-containing protein [Chloroflexota bacterium]
REERVNVERRPVERPAAEADFDHLQEGTLEVRECREEPVVEKQARVVEEVVVGKEAQERTETVQDTVRRTDVDVQEIPGGERSTGYTETGRTSTADVSSTGTTSSTRSADVSQAGGSEGPIERTLGDVKSGAERATGRDLDRSGEVGDRDRRDNV